MTQSVHQVVQDGVLEPQATHALAELKGMNFDMIPTLVPPLILQLRSKLVYIVFILAVALLYDTLEYRTVASGDVGVQIAEADYMRVESDSKFHDGIFQAGDCFGKDRALCFCAFFCTSIRWAHTVSQPKLQLQTSFWAAVIASGFFSVHGMWPGSAPAIVLILFGVAMCVNFRQTLRAKSDMESGSLATVMQDILAWTFCPCCAAAQEARQVEHMRTKTF